MRKQHRRHTLDLLGQRKGRERQRSHGEALWICLAWATVSPCGVPGAAPPRRQLGRGRRIIFHIMECIIHTLYKYSVIIVIWIVLGTLHSELVFGIHVPCTWQVDFKAAQCPVDFSHTSTMVVTSHTEQVTPDLLTVTRRPPDVFAHSSPESMCLFW